MMKCPFSICRQNAPFCAYYFQNRYMKFRILNFCFSLLFAYASLQGQTLTGDKSQPLSKSKEDRLIAVLNQAIELQINQNWAEVYNLLKKPISFYDKTDVNQTDFIKQMTKYSSIDRLKILEFTSVEIFYNGDETDGFALVFGCGKYKDGISKRKYKTQTEAYLIKGEWQISDIPHPSVGIDSSDLQKCEKSFKTTR